MLAEYIAALVILFISRSLTDGIGYRSIGVNALTLNAHESRLWEENSSMIHGIAQQRLCRDGSAPKLERIQLDGELTTYELRCGDKSWMNASMDAVELHKRQQTTTLCSTSCNHDCYSSLDFTPGAADCTSLSAMVRSRSVTWNVPAGGIIAVQLRTCVYTFTNKLQNTLNFCDLAWASICDSIGSTCGPPSTGGLCSTSDFYVKAIGAPTASTTVSSQSGLAHNTESGALESGTTPASSSSTSIGTTQSPDARKMDTAAIIGGTVGGIAAVAFLLTAFFMVRRAKHYKEIQSGRVDQYASSTHVTSSKPTSTSSKPDPLMTPVSSALIDAQDDKIILSYGFISTLAAHTASQGPLSVRREQPATPAAQRVLTGSVTINPLVTEHHSLEDSPPQDAAVSPPTVEALIAAAAPPEMSQEQINLLAANFMSLMRGDQPRGDRNQGDEGANEIRQPPPYQ